MSSAGAPQELLRLCGQHLLSTSHLAPRKAPPHTGPLPDILRTSLTVSSGAIKEPTGNIWIYQQSQEVLHTSYMFFVAPLQFLVDLYDKFPPSL
ncbi:hypothetical protein M422DRAFT_263092 [Sphaerobolus stellatus SS14]|uniref:Uncharacterized protein n=1 Tax=Sphaerobolus stellatus (strain SS14) TaxID=990650 RepID=A0A0C9VB68_SPHS4|nr:hypothetical protein M422DRAFT_263092 [Sphaerobolus stellatus SS14]